MRVYHRMTATWCMVCTALAFLTGPAVSDAAGNVIRGRVVVPLVSHDSATFNAYPGRAHGSMPEPDDALSSHSYVDVVVYLRGELDGRPPQRSSPAVLAQSGMEFVPRVLPIVRGERVEFPNFDPFYHNVFSYSRVKRFDLGKYGEGHTEIVEFLEPGEVRVFCDIHPEMNAVILVLENPFFTVPDETGGYEITGVPAGVYDVVAFHPDYPERSTQVTVGGATVADVVVTLQP